VEFHTPPEYSYKIIDFVRNYADKHHCGRKQMFSNKILNEVGTTVKELAR